MFTCGVSTVSFAVAGSTTLLHRYGLTIPRRTAQAPLARTNNREWTAESRVPQQWLPKECAVERRWTSTHQTPATALQSAPDSCSEGLAINGAIIYGSTFRYRLCTKAVILARL